MAGSIIEQISQHLGHSVFDIHLYRSVLLYIDRVVFFLSQIGDVRETVESDTTGGLGQH